MSKMSKFAGLLGLSAKKAEDEKEKDKDMDAEKPTQGDDESDEDFKDRLKKWEDEQDDDDDGEEDKDDEAKKKGKRAAEEPKDTTDDGPTEEDKKLKKAESAGFAKGFAAGGKRWEDVLASAAAKGKPITAMNLLADTSLSASAIRQTLAAPPWRPARP